MFRKQNFQWCWNGSSFWRIRTQNLVTRLDLCDTFWFGELKETKPQRDTNASDESKVDLKYFTYRTTTVGGLENIFCELVWDILPKKCLQTILTTTIFRDLLWGKWWEMDRLTQKQICVFTFLWLRNSASFPAVLGRTKNRYFIKLDLDLQAK